MAVAGRLCLAAVAAAQPPSRILQEIGIEPQLGTRVPDAAAFRDHHGEPVRLGGLLRGRPVVLCLVYFECPHAVPHGRPTA